MAFIYDSTKVINFITFTPCSHRETTDFTGKPIDPMLADHLIDLEEYRTHHHQVHYPCSACAVSEDYMSMMAAHLSPPDQITTYTPSCYPPHVEQPTMSVKAAPFSPPTGPRADQKTRSHRPGRPCPEKHPNCHEHYGTEKCHLPWEKCSFARKAVRSAFYAKNIWKGAPEGWNDEHAHCVQGTDLCDFHERIVKEMQTTVKDC